MTSRTVQVKIEGDASNVLAAIGSVREALADLDDLLQVKRLSLAPGESLALLLRENDMRWSDAEMVALKESVQDLFPDNRVIIFDGVEDIAVFPAVTNAVS